MIIYHKIHVSVHSFIWFDYMFVLIKKCRLSKYICNIWNYKKTFPYKNTGFDMPVGEDLD